MKEIENHSLWMMILKCWNTIATSHAKAKKIECEFFFDEKWPNERYGEKLKPRCNARASIVSI